MRLDIRLNSWNGIFILILTRILISFTMFFDFYFNQRPKVLFIVRLSIFISSMFILLIGKDSPLEAMVSWDLLGLSSYFLVNTYRNWKSSRGALITLFRNLVGEVPYLLMFSIFSFSWDYILGFSLLTLTLASKRGMYPFSSWLPEAMAAPTPVRTLVHSRTLVTAPSFLRDILTLGLNLEPIMVGISTLSVVQSMVSSFQERDLKKLIALSTLRNICTAFSLRFRVDFSEVVFFLSLHGELKRSIFILGGALLSSSFGRQEVRIIRRLKYRNVFLTTLLLFCLFCLIGFPYNFNSFVKDWLLGLEGQKEGSIFLFFLTLLLLISTSIYSWKLISSLGKRVVPKQLKIGGVFELYSTTLNLVFCTLSLFQILRLIMREEPFSRESEKHLFLILIFVIWLVTKGMSLVSRGLRETLQSWRGLVISLFIFSLCIIWTMLDVLSDLILKAPLLVLFRRTLLIMVVFV